MSRIRICDRCKDIIESDETSYVVKAMKRDPGEVTLRRLTEESDLCEDCYGSLQRFLAERRGGVIHEKNEVIIPLDKIAELL